MSNKSDQQEVEIITNAKGYEYLCVDGELVSHHRLLACRDNEVEQVSDQDCHHRVGIEWLNIAENIDVIGRSKHAQIHAEEALQNEQEVLD